MATYYVGPRPVLKGRSTADMVNPFKGTAGTYSFYPLFAPGLLTGAPDNDHVPGTGYHPGNVLLSQLFTGSTLYAGTTPLAGTFADGTTTFGGMRFRPSEYKGLTTAKALDGGHAKRTTDYSLYSNYIFDGVTSAEVMPAGYGQANTASEYGRNKVGEYKGVPSAVAL